MDIQQKAEEIINQFKDDFKKISEDALSDVYSEILPHAENDTYCNVGYRSQRVIERAIKGEFNRIDENTVSIKDDNNIDVLIKITDHDWDRMRESLIKAMPACPKDLEIESLKKTIAMYEFI